MAFLTSYRQVLAVPGAAAFSLTGIVARLPVSMTSLGIVLLVEASTGSYGTAGAVAAAFTVTNALLAVVQGRLIDRWGQGAVLTVGAVLFSIAMALLITAQVAEWPPVATYLAAAVGGGTLPQVSACVRARWAYVMKDRSRIPTAFALEGVFDEVVFMVGPVLATFLATQWYAWSGLATAVVCGLVGTLAFAAQRGTAPPAGRDAQTETGSSPLPWGTVLPLALVCVGLGTFFGAGEVTTVALAEELGRPSAAGILLALWAFGSLLAGVVSGAVIWRQGPAFRVRVGTVLMALSLVPLIWVGDIVVAGVFLLAAGVCVAPTLIAGFSLAEERLPSSRLTEGMAVLQTGMVIGVAAGASLSGIVVDAHGANAAYLVSVVAAAVAALVAQALPRAR